MSIEKPEFAHACRRSREEMVRAINARSDAAAASHRQLSMLHAMRAVTMMSRNGSAVDGSDRQLEGIVELVWLDGGMMRR